MSDPVSIQPGRYNITPDVWFDVCPADNGVRLCLCDVRANRKYTVTIDEECALSWKEVNKLSPDVPDPQPTPGKPLPKLIPGAAPKHYRPPQPPQQPSPLAAFKASRIRFLVQHRDDSRYRNHCFALGGYTDGNTTYVLFRVKNSFEGLGKLLPNDQIVLKDENDPSRLPRADFASLLNMAPGSHFRLNDKIWQSLSPEELEPTVSGQVYRVVNLTFG